MTDASPDLLFGQHPKIACLSSAGQKRYIYIYIYIYIRRTSRRILFWKAPKGKLAKLASFGGSVLGWSFSKFGLAIFGPTPDPPPDPHS